MRTKHFDKALHFKKALRIAMAIIDPGGFHTFSSYNSTYKKFKLIIDALARRGHHCDIQRQYVKKGDIWFNVLINYEIVKSYRIRESAKRNIAKHLIKVANNEIKEHS